MALKKLQRRKEKKTAGQQGIPRLLLQFDATALNGAKAQQCYPPLLLYHQCKYQQSEKGK